MTETLKGDSSNWDGYNSDLPIGTLKDPMETYGTRDEDEKNTVNKLTHANGVEAETLKGDINNLPPEAIAKIISLRFKNTANALDDWGSDKKEVGKNMYLDLSIIAATLDSGKEIPGMDISQYMGEEDVRDISGVLDAYEEKVKNSGKNIVLIDAMGGENQEPRSALEVIGIMKSSIEKPTDNTEA